MKWKHVPIKNGAVSIRRNMRRVEIVFRNLSEEFAKDLIMRMRCFDVELRDGHRMTRMSLERAGRTWKKGGKIWYRIAR